MRYKGFDEEKMVKKIICARCNVGMKKAVLDSYEYLEGLPIHNVECYKCPKCKQITFTEEQADKMEEMTEKEMDKKFIFIRKVSYSGRSLVINIPEDLVAHLEIERGQKVKIMPLDKKGFLVEVKK